MPERRYPCPGCDGAGTGTDPAPWTCLSCGGTGEYIVSEQQLVEVLTDTSWQLLGWTVAKERGRNCAAVLVVDELDPAGPEFRSTVVRMLGRARDPLYGGVDVDDEDLAEVARRVAAYVRGEDLFPRPVKPGESRAAEPGERPGNGVRPPVSDAQQPDGPSTLSAASEPAVPRETTTTGAGIHTQPRSSSSPSWSLSGSRAEEVG